MTGWTSSQINAIYNSYTAKKVWCLGKIRNSIVVYEVLLTRPLLQTIHLSAKILTYTLLVETSGGPYIHNINNNNIIHVKRILQSTMRP